MRRTLFVLWSVAQFALVAQAAGAGQRDAETLDYFVKLVPYYAHGFGVVAYVPPSATWPQGRGERIDVHPMSFDPRDIGLPKRTLAWTAWQNDPCPDQPSMSDPSAPLFCGGHWVVEVDQSWLRHADLDAIKFVAAHEAAHMVFTPRDHPRGVDKKHEREIDDYAWRACGCKHAERRRGWLLGVALILL